MGGFKNLRIVMAYVR